MDGLKQAASVGGRGFMVVCDGSNGAGKTTLLESLNRYLQRRGFDVVLSREPGGTPVGERIRELLLDPGLPEMCDLTELLLFAAARAQHLQEKILPALGAGKVVLCDRFDSATFAFQQYARGLDPGMVTRVNELALNGFRPDLYLILDLDPLLGLERVKQRGVNLDRLEAEKLAFLQRAREGFLHQAKADPHRFRVLDASRGADEVADEARALIEELISGFSARAPGSRAANS